MKAIMVMYDSLRRDLLSCNGGPIPTPNFERLAARTVGFENCYVGSLPCMPARRELHTGRYNFLHRSWGPVEPFDLSMPQILKENGIHAHLATDHYHYIQDGGATYCGRYSTWDCARGQESDSWIADLSPRDGEFAPNQLSPENTSGPMREARKQGGWQNMSNRGAVKDESDYPMNHTFENGIDFLKRNGKYDRWFLQIETFDPHEPFTSPESFQAGFLSPDALEGPDWPPYAPVCEDPKAVENMRRKYYGLTAFCDWQLGRILDLMDEMDLWKDTMLIVNTDHGFLLSEHDWWGKGSMPCYEELVHTPLFIWDPRSQKKGEKRKALVQTIDLAPTLLDYFGLEIPEQMLGKPLKEVIESDEPVRQYALFGYHGAPVGITDGRYTLLHGVADSSVKSYEYTLMPTHMKAMFSAKELKTAILHQGFSFTKGVPVLKIEARVNPRFLKTIPEGEDLLFDLEKDPGQKNPLTAPEIRERLLSAMAGLFLENEAPEELYERYGLQGRRYGEMQREKQIEMQKEM